MQKRCQALPTQFIPRHSHKYIMRKTLVNTKFQWLMKYLDTDQEPTPSNPNNLSSAIRLHPHPPSTLLQPHPRPNHAARSTTLYPHKRTLTEEPACELKDPPIDSTLKCRPARSRINTRVKTDQSEQKIFVEKKHIRNKSLLFHNTNARKTPVFFEKEKENRSTTSKIKLKTESAVVRCKTRAMARERYENEPFVLSPWGLMEENADPADMPTFF